MTGAADVEVFLDDTPGETRGVIARGGRYTHLLIHREEEAAQHRLGARSVGRVTQIIPGLRGAFVDLGAGPDAFLPLGRNDSLAQGARIEVAVVAEPRDGKGAAVRRLGPGEGDGLGRPRPCTVECKVLCTVLYGYFRLTLHDD